MRAQIRKVSVARVQETKILPCDIYERPSTSPWTSVEMPIGDEWQLAEERLIKNLDQLIRVQLYPYLVPQDPISAIAFAMKVASRAVLLTGAKEVIISCGDPLLVAENPSDGQWQLWLGFAVRR